MVKRASGRRTRLFIQLIDFLAIRRRPEPSKFFERFLTITSAHRCAQGLPHAPDAAVRARIAALPDADLDRALAPRELESLRYGFSERVSDLELPHVRDLPATLPGRFGAAARRAEDAGFDGVELHYAHAYTIASFLSRTNDRDDGYGRTLEGRLRLPLEVFARARESVGKSFVVGCRFLTVECFEGGSPLDDARAFGVAFARAGMDFSPLRAAASSTTRSNPPSVPPPTPNTGPSGYECIPQYVRTHRVRSGATPLRPKASGTRHARLALLPRLSAQGASTILRWLSGGWPTAFATSSALPDSHSPIRTGRSKSIWDEAVRSEPANSRTIAKASTKNTSK